MIVFIIAFSLFTLLQASPTLADPDSFYHIKAAELIRDQGIIKDFPWLQATTLKDNYTDHHFLYHLLLIPFVTIFDRFVGAKIATIFFAALVITFFYWVLRKFEIKYSLFYVLLAISSSPFVFRINLTKVPALSIIVLLIGLYLIFKRRHGLLFILSFFYVWLYGGFPLIVGLTGFYLIATGFKRLIEIKKVRLALKGIVSLTNLKLLAASLGGIVLGILFSPYFPQNLNFYWQQIIKIGVINYQSVIGVGGEWYPYGFLELLGGTAFVFMLWLVAGVLFLITIKKQSVKSWTLLLAAVFFFIFTLKSRRNVEYFVPLTILFGAFAVNDALPLKFSLLSFWRELKSNYLSKYKVLIYGIIVYLAAVFIFVSVRDMLNTKKALAGFSPAKFEAASQWLKDNPAVAASPSGFTGGTGGTGSQPGGIVFHSDWDEFPLLFYHNHHNYYLVGLDPTFMYENDQDLYWQWANITLGKTGGNLYDIIKTRFQSSYVFIEKAGHEAMTRNIELDGNFEKVYEDQETVIYQL